MSITGTTAITLSLPFISHSNFTPFSPAILVLEPRMELDASTRLLLGQLEVNQVEGDN